MKKSGYGKLSIIFILIATLVCCAAIAIFGLSTGNITGAIDSSAEISAPDKTASSAIRDEESSDGTIPAPEVSAQATTSYTGLNHTNWNNAVASSGNTIATGGGKGTMVYTGTFTVPAGITLNLVISANDTIMDVRGAGYSTFVVEATGILNVTGGGTLDGYGSTQCAFNVYKGGTLNFNGPTITNYRRGVDLGNGPGGAWGDATFTMSGGTISGNTTTGDGGGVYVYSSIFHMNGGTISGNTAENGGGVYVGRGGTFYMYAGTITGNTATGNGGGVCVTYDGKFGMSGGNIGAGGNGNTAMNGGGVFLTSTKNATMTGGYIAYNKATTGAGGGVYVEKSTFTMKPMSGNSTYIISNNAKASHGGGVYVNAGAIFDMQGGNVVGNANFGGGVSTMGTFIMSGGSIYNCTADFGAAVCSYNAGIFNMGGGNIYSNAARQQGGGVWISSSGAFNLSGGTCGNQANGYNTAQEGGCVWMSSGTFTMTGGGVYHGKATGYGGGVFMSGGTFTMNASGSNNTNALVAWNEAPEGAGIYQEGGTFQLKYGYITRNTANRGGGVYYCGGTFTATGGVIGGTTPNTATAVDGEEGLGGGLFISGGRTFTPGGLEISCNTADRRGGGVYVDYGTLNLNNTATVIKNNHATSYGGGVCVGGDTASARGRLTMTAGSIQGNNRATNGGGIAAIYYGVLSLRGGEIINNNATSNGGGVIVQTIGTNTEHVIATTIKGNASTNFGGGLAVYTSNGDKVKLTAGSISGNKASESGGGVFAYTGIFEITGGEIYENTAKVVGGGVSQGVQCAFTMSGGKIRNNTVETTTSTFGGGGVYTIGTFNMTAGEIYSNSSNYVGGGVEVNNNGKLTMTGGYIRNNSANKGAGVYLREGGSRFELDGGTVKDNATPGESGCYGGGVYSAGILTVTSGTISGNTAMAGGGVWVNAGTFTMTGGTVSGNGAAGNGAAVYVLSGGAFNLGGGEITGNAADQNGAVFSAGTLAMTGGKITGNTATGNGGVYITNTGTFNMSAGEISGNAAVHGAGVYNNGTLTIGGTALITRNRLFAAGGVGLGGGVYTVGTFNMNGGVISENTAPRGAGVAVASTGAGMTMTAGVISGNTASLYGGGVYHTGTFNMQGGKIINNTSGDAGGGVNVANMSFVMEGGEISGNTAVRGAGVNFGDKSFSMSGGAQISGNTATGNGGGVYGNGGTFTMNAGEISGNTAAYGGGAYILNGTITVSSRITGNSATNGIAGGVYLGEGGTLNAGGQAYIYGNTYYGAQNNVYLTGQGSVTLSSKLTSGAKIGVVATTDFTVTSGFTAAGHTAADVQTYFIADLHGLVLSYKNNEVVTSYSLVNGWNETVTASMNGKTTETFILFTDWTAANGEFGTGAGFYDDGAIFVPAGSSIVLNLNGRTIARAGDTGSAIRVAGALVIEDNGGGAITGVKTETGAVCVIGGRLTLNGGSICDNAVGYGGVYVDENGAFTMAGGEIVRNTAERGAGVYVKNGSFTMTGGVIGGSDGNANKASSYGGGVYIDGGTFVMSGGEISRNTAGRGAGVYVGGGKFTLTGDGYVTANAATGNGGGIYLGGGNLEITGGFVSGNTAANGAGISVGSGAAVVNGGKIFKNTATEYGGGVFASGGRVTVEDGEIYENTAESGGGVYVAGTATRFTLAGGSVRGNTAANGAGVYVSGGVFTVSDGGRVTANAATANGGGIYVGGGNLEMTGGEISENTAPYGGGVFGESAFNMSGGEISENTAEKGAGVYVSDGVFTVSDGGRITANAAAANGGGIYLGGGNLEITGGEISGNTAKNGGGVFGESAFNMSGGEISDNTANKTGGGVFVTAGGTFTMTGGDISNNVIKAEEGGGGGGVYTAGVFEMTGGNITGNTSENATGNNGGGGVYNEGAFTISGAAVISGNTTSNRAVENYGGGVYSKGGSFTMSGGEISGNESSRDGGGVYIYSGKFTMTAGAISDNRAEDNSAVTHGGGVQMRDGTFTMSGGKISGNYAGANSGGGGISMYDGTFDMTGGEISGNSATVCGGGAVVYGGVFTMSGGEISGNTVTGFSTNSYGGGVNVSKISATGDVYGKFVMTGGKISGNVAENSNTAYGSGGGLNVESGAEVEINGGEISGNTAVHGGGVHVKPAGVFSMTKGVVSGNTASKNGGGFNLNGADVTNVEITGGSVSENTADGNGGGVYLTGNFVSLRLGGTATVAQNEAAGNGGGISVLDGASAEIADNASVAYNTAAVNGGGANVNGAGSTLTLVGNGAITNNAANYGGAVYVTAGGAFTMENGALSHNEARNSGGAVYVTGSAFTMSGGEISANSAVNNGGGVYVAASSASSFVMTGGTIGGEDEASANGAALGGGLYVAGGKVTFTSGEITGNAATGNGAGVYFSAGTLEMSGNPAIYGNAMRDVASNLYLYNNKTVTIAGVLTDGAQIGVTGTGQITEGYTLGGNGEGGKNYFFGDVAGSIVAIVADEIHLNISLESAWNAAVQSSYDSHGAPVEFMLVESWTAEDGSFGAGVGFTENGALYLPAGTYVILNLNGYSINRDLNAVIAEGSVIYVKGTLEIAGSTGYVRGGASGQGGGVHVEEGGLFILSAGYLQNNEATLGGAVYVESGAEFEMNGGTVNLNRAQKGGAVYVEKGGAFSLMRGTISGNEASESGGGAYVGGTFAMAGGTVGGNTATRGAGVAVDFGGEFTLSGGTISGNNTAALTDGNYGGGVLAVGEFEMNGGEISGNTAMAGGGVFVAARGTLEIAGGIISSNEASYAGGGVFVTDGGTFEMSNGTINNNTATRGVGVYVKGGEFTLSGGTISGNNTVALEGGNYGGGIGIGANGTFEMTGGTVSGNTAMAGGGVHNDGTFVMAGGEITGNEASWGGGGVCAGGNGTTVITDGTVSGNASKAYGGGLYINKDAGSVELRGGEISGNTAQHGGGIALMSGTLNISGGTVSANTATCSAAKIYGGGVYVRDGEFTMDGGSIRDNEVVATASTSITYGGGVYVEGGKFTLNDGNVAGNAAAGGGGIGIGENGAVEINGGAVSENNGGNGAIYTWGTLTMNGGAISDNEAIGNGGGVCVVSGTSAMNGGTISGNTTLQQGAGVYIYNGKFVMNGGVITANTAAGSFGGGVYVQSNQGGLNPVFEISGSPMIYGNTADGVESNVYLAANQIIVVTGMLSVNGIAAMIGVAMADPKRFTQGFYENNTAYNPTLLPSTVFFADDGYYMVAADADNEGILKANDYSRTTLNWQFSKDGGESWISVEAPYFALRYKVDESYAVRALDGAGNPVDFTWATDGDDNEIDGASFDGIGSYKFVINSENYYNPSLTFEILPAKLIWQYSTDEGGTWSDFTADSAAYTGATYQVRAIVYYDAENPVELLQAGAMHDAGNYKYEVKDAETYENPVFSFEIKIRRVTVEWSFGDAIGNAASGYYWNYDGLTHAPVAVLGGVSGELAGADLTYVYTWSGDVNTHSSALKYAGEYTLEVVLNDPNVALSNTSVQYKINGVTLSLVWTDKDGNEGEEFTFGYDGEKHGLNVILSGVVAGETVEPYITYATRAGRELGEAPTAAGYYVATVKLPAGCYNYSLDKVYTCQIFITQKTVEVEWIGNEDGAYSWTFNGKSNAPVASITSPITGEALGEAYKTEYAPVASNGDVGTYTTAQPVSAGNYIVRVTLNNAEGNYVLDEATATCLFTIEKRGVEVAWTGKDYLYDEAKDAYYWYYDGEEHGIEAKIDLNGLFIYKDGAIISSLEIERTDGQTILTSAASATATVALANTPFNENFYISGNASQVYEVRKAVIGSVIWTDAFKNEYGAGDVAEFDFGAVSGENGPGFAAVADGKCGLIVSYSKTYPGDWVVDEDCGYTAYARLSEEDALNYEFENGAEYASLTFFIKSVGGIKQDIDVTWVVFVNENEYVSLEEYLSGGGFVYNGKVQYPTPIYIKENGVDFEILDLNTNSVGADAGEYTARLKPSAVYNVKEEDFTCDYEIKKLDIIVGWQDGLYDGNDTFNYVYNGSEQAPYAYAAGGYGLEIEITVKGKTDAGTYLAIADAGNNFNIVEGKTQVYTISKLGLEAGLVIWDYTGASGDKDNGWYWVYDYEEHAPKATVLTEQGILELVVTGKTSEIGTHVAHATLNSSIAGHNNYYLIGTASTTFEIVQITVGQVYWTEKEFTYDGGAHAPAAYFYAEEGAEPTYLNVTVIGGSAVEAGSYTAYVSSELGFTAPPTCNFTVKAMELNAGWSDRALTFNGERQSPTLTLSEGADGYVLQEGDDYVITSFLKAGTYTVQVRFINTNYTVAEEDLTCEFVIEKITLTEDDFKWSEDGYDEDRGGYVWLFDENEHAPTLTITYTLGESEVVFELGYTGVTPTVGVHKVTAYIKSATITVDGEETDVTDSFALSAEMEYEIVASVVTIDWDWTGATYDADRNAYYWTFDGDYHAPKAYLADENGDRIKDEHGNDVEIVDIYGAEKNARDTAYTATAVVPAEYNFTGDATAQFYIDKATIEVNWDFGEAVYDDENGVYVWTYGDEVEPKAYIRLDDGSNGAALDVTGFETDAGTHALSVMQSNGNYVFASEDDSTQRYVINPMTVYVIWYGVGGYGERDTENFKWTYGDEEPAPTAYLAYKDESGALQPLTDKDGNAIPVEVSGRVEEVGDHIAQAVDTFVNYEFAEEVFTRPYTILAKNLANSNFGWTADGAKEVEGLTFTYEYSGDRIMPAPSSEVDGLEFNTTIVKVNGDGTEKPVLVITERGTYKVTATSVDANYAVPEGLETVTVIVTAKTVEATWDKTPLVYDGANQQPKAYYQDVAGEWLELDVTVVGGPAVNAGATYTATAAQPSDTNYVLDGSTVTELFEIEQKVLPVEWIWEDVTYDGNEHAPVPVVTSTEKDGISVVYGITLNGETAAEDGGKVVNAGSYVLRVWLEGPAKGNYKLDVDEFNFTINRRPLEITANDREATYGDTLTLTVDDVTLANGAESGLVAADADAVMDYLKDNLNNWLSCHYVNTSAPGEYTVFVDALWLNERLANYEVTGRHGTLTVIPAEGKLVWQADGNGEDGTPVFVYDGGENLPRAYYYDASARNYVNLDVRLAEYDEASGAYTAVDGKPVNAGTYYAVIVDGDGNVITEHGSYTFDNFGVKFEITKRDIVINVNGLTFAYGEVSEENLAELLGPDNGWYFGEVKPVDGDDLGITLTIEETCENGFLNAGTYRVVISWNGAEFGGNYTVNDDLEITLAVEKAEVTVNLDKDGAYYLNDYVILTNGHECDFLDAPGNFIEIAGYQGADVSVRFSEAFVKGTEPPAEDYEYGNDTLANVTEAGYYVFNFKITADNHETLFGQLLVKAVEKENVLYVTVIKDLNEKYGFEVTETLAQRLFEDGCARYDADISPAAEEDFLKWITATVVDADGNAVSGKLAVGTYKVIFGLSGEAPSRYSVHVNDSNHVYIEITKYVIDIDWGDESNLNYVYDGEIHMPVITVAGTVLGEDNKVGDGVFVISVLGEEVRVTVTVNGDFTAVGGHSVLVTVESENFELDADNLRSVSVKAPAEVQQVATGGLSGWQLWVLIAAAVLLALIIVVLIIALAKRKPVSDDDGFYDPVDE